MKMGVVAGEKVGGGEGDAEMVDGIVWCDCIAWKFRWMIWLYK